MPKREPSGEYADTTIARMEAQFDDVPQIYDTLREGREFYADLFAHDEHEPTAYYLGHDLVGDSTWLIRRNRAFDTPAPSTARAWKVWRETITRRLAEETAAVARAAGTAAPQRKSIDRFAEWLSAVPASRRELIQVDLEYLLKRLGLIYGERQSEIWLQSFNYHLNSRPLDVLSERGAAEVIAALDAEEAGSY